MSTVFGAPPYLFGQQGSQPAPFEYDVPASLEVVPTAATATFDGTGASGDFLACLSFYSQAGNLLSRVFPTAKVTAGDVAQVSYAPFPGGMTSGGGGGTTGFEQIYDATGVSISAGNSASLPWKFSDGDTLLDLTTATAPTVIAAGEYAITTIMRKAVGGGLAPDGTLFGGVLTIPAINPPQFLEGNFVWKNTGGNVPGLTMSVTKPFAAGDVLIYTGDNNSAVTVFLALAAYVTRLS